MQAGPHAQKKETRLCSDPLLLSGLPRHFHPPQKCTPVEFPLIGQANALNMQFGDAERQEL